MPNTQDKIAEIYDAHSDALFGFLLNLTRNDTDACDLLQALFVKLARQQQPLDGVTKPRAYLLTTVHRLFIDHTRHESSRRRTTNGFAEEQTGTLFEEHAIDAGLRRRTEQLIAKLPSDQRAVVHLKIWENMSFTEIGDAVGVSKATAASRYRYALEKLRDGFGSELELLKG